MGMSMSVARVTGRSRWLVGNILGILAFLVTASQFWIEPELAGVPGASGGSAFGWIIMAVPIFAVFLATNLIWLFVSLWRGIRTGKWSSISIAMLVIAAWCAAYRFDNAHHGI
jgi:hypothetical protein